MKKKILHILFSIFLIFVGIISTVIFEISVFPERTLQVQRLEREIKEEYRPLVEKEERIKMMEKTLMIHYKLSWYEAHYYSIIFDDFSQKYGIPWQVYPAMIRVESNFDPTCRSTKGATGITQLMSATAESVAEKLDIPYEKSTLWNDLINMVIGLTYLSEGIQELGLEDGIKRYIGGPGFDKGRKDIGKYRTTVRWEFERLKYIHQGVINLPIIDTMKFEKDSSSDGID